MAFDDLAIQVLNQEASQPTYMFVFNKLLLVLRLLVKGCKSSRLTGCSVFLHHDEFFALFLKGYKSWVKSAKHRAFWVILTQGSL
jgi:hypothetical protein